MEAVLKKDEDTDQGVDVPPWTELEEKKIATETEPLLEEDTDRLINVYTKDKNFFMPVSTKARSVVGLMDNVLIGDVEAEYIYTQCEAPWELNLIFEFVMHFLGIEPEKEILSLKKSNLEDTAFTDEFLKKLSCMECCKLIKATQFLGIDILQNLLEELMISKLEKYDTKDILQLFKYCKWKENIDQNLVLINEKPVLEMKSDVPSLFKIFKNFQEKIYVLHEKSLFTFPLLKVVKAMEENYSFLEVHQNISSLSTPFWKHLCCKYASTVHSDTILTETEAKLCDELQSIKDDSLQVQEFKFEKKSNFGEDIIRSLVAYCRHHKGVVPVEIAKPIRSVKMIKIVDDPWDAEFILSFNKKKLFQVILCANAIKCTPLLHLGSARIATMIKGKSPEEIKEILSGVSVSTEKKDNDTPTENTISDEDILEAEEEEEEEENFVFDTNPLDHINIVPDMGGNNAYVSGTKKNNDSGNSFSSKIKRGCQIEKINEENMLNLHYDEIYRRLRNSQLPLSVQFKYNAKNEIKMIACSLSNSSPEHVEQTVGILPSGKGIHILPLVDLRGLLFKELKNYTRAFNITLPKFFDKRILLKVIEMSGKYQAETVVAEQKAVAQVARKISTKRTFGLTLQYR